MQLGRDLWSNLLLKTGSAMRSEQVVHGFAQPNTTSSSA